MEQGPPVENQDDGPAKNQDDGPMEKDSVKRFLTDAARLEDMPMGTNVVLDGLVSRPDLNGATGRVSGPPSGPSRARYALVHGQNAVHQRQQPLNVRLPRRGVGAGDVAPSRGGWRGLRAGDGDSDDGELPSWQVGDPAGPAGPRCLPLALTLTLTRP